MYIRRKEKSHLEKFKFQARVSKEFGKKAILVYNAIPKDDWADEDEIANKIKNIDKDFVLKVIDFMEKEGMLDAKEQKEAAATPATEEVGEETKAKVEETPEKPSETEEIEEITPEKVEEEIEPEEITPEIEPEISGGEEEIEVEREEPPPKKEGEEEIEIEGPSEETPEKAPAEEVPEISAGEITPEIEPETLGGEEGDEEETSEEEGVDLSQYSEDEIKVYKHFGDIGVEVYRAAKEGKSIRDIMVENNLGEEDVKKIMKFLDDNDLLIKAAGEESEESEEEDRFAPLSSELEESSKLIPESEEEGIKAVKMKKLDFLSGMTSKFDVVLKFKKRGRIIFELLSDGQERDEITIIRQTKIPVTFVEKVLDYLKSKGLLEERILSRAEIRKRFGYDSLTVYRKYGKRGVIMYDFVGRDLSLKQIAQLAGYKDKEMIYKVFSFIHKLLGIDMPLDKSLIMKQLE